MSMSWGRRVCTWLEKVGKLAWLPILIVGILSVVVGVANYRLQTSAIRQNLASAGARINQNVHPESIVVFWNNIGNKPARRGTATLFTVSEDMRRREKIGSAAITGA